MLAIPSTGPSPLIQTCVYMAGILTGYVLLTTPDEWQRAWAVLRDVLGRGRRRE
ncbi:MAG TPA: hypothetical protein VH763_09850 [Gemmatimonadales bacterium]|jgi:hypothetical protein